MQEEDIVVAAAGAAQDKEEACPEVATADENSGGKSIEADETESDSLNKKPDVCESRGASLEAVMLALSDREVRERLIYGDEEICNEIIRRYLDELSYPKSVPLVRGFSALSPLPRPKTLSEAKAIVDKGKIK